MGGAGTERKGRAEWGARNEALAGDGDDEDGGGSGRKVVRGGKVTAM